jgi:hypothetical protein
VLREFNRALEALGPRPTPDQARAAVPALDEAHARAELVGERLERARLADARLEAQRAQAASAYGRVVEGMDAVVAEARAGRPVRLATAVADYQEAVDALERELGAPTG